MEKIEKKIFEEYRMDIIRLADDVILTSQPLVDSTNGGDNVDPGIATDPEFGD